MTAEKSFIALGPDGQVRVRPCSLVKGSNPRRCLEIVEDDEDDENDNDNLGSVS